MVPLIDWSGASGTSLVGRCVSGGTLVDKATARESLMAPLDSVQVACPLCSKLMTARALRFKHTCERKRRSDAQIAKVDHAQLAVEGFLRRVGAQMRPETGKLQQSEGVAYAHDGEDEKGG